MQAPVLVSAEGDAYEPSIVAGTSNELYITAHKSDLVHEGTQLSSWLWWSPDGGASWQDVRQAASPDSKEPALEGDVAVDANGRLYYVDTYVEDVTFARYAPSSSGPVLEFARPAIGTLGEDDRPWIAAQGDGVLYLLTNKADAEGSILPPPDNGGRGNIWIVTSTDRGLTWSLGHAFDGSQWCTVAASPADDRTVSVGCEQHDGTRVGYLSSDRGATWHAAAMGSAQNGHGDFHPSSAMDGAGVAYHAFIDGVPGVADRVQVARQVQDHWDVMDLTPWMGSFVYVAVAASHSGRVAVAFESTHDVRPGATSEWKAYALVNDHPGDERSSWTLVSLDPQPVATGPLPPGDFIRATFTPQEKLVVAYTRATASATPTTTIAGRVYVVREA
jgi:hypothetical protein